MLELEGLNEDGQSLIAGYEYSGKDREDVTGELVERAIDMGYLSGGETVSITVTSADADWQAREETQIQEQLEERYGEAYAQLLLKVNPRRILEDRQIFYEPSPERKRKRRWFL